MITHQHNYRKARTCILLCVLGSLTASCGGQRRILAPQEHVILIDQNGDALNPETKSLKIHPSRFPDDTTEYKFNEHVQTILDSIDAYQDTLGQDSLRILIYVHGGLNSQAASLDRASALYEIIKKDGFYPIFINWQANLFVSLRERLTRVRQGKKPSRLLAYPSTIPLIVSILAKGIADIPSVFAQQLYDDWTIMPFSWAKAHDQKNAEELYRRLKAADSTTISWRDVDRRMFSPIALSYVKTLPIKVATSFLISELGSEAWTNLLRHTNTPFWKAKQFDIGDQRTGSIIQDNISMPSEGDGALSVFMTELLEFLETKDYKITLVGHSMGAVVLNRLIKLFPHFNYENIIYLAAACSIREFKDSVIPYLESDSTSKFYNLSLHPLAEKRELTFLDIPHRGSLLNWIDNFYSDPETHLDRRLGKWENIIQATNIIPRNIKKQVHLKAFGLGTNPKPTHADSLISYKNDLPGPQTHGGFNGFKFWKKEYWTPFRADVAPQRRIISAPRQFYAELSYRRLKDGIPEPGVGSLRIGWVFNSIIALGASYHRSIGDTMPEIWYAGFDVDNLSGAFVYKTLIGVGEAAGSRIFVIDPSLQYRVLNKKHFNVGAGLGYRWARFTSGRPFKNSDLRKFYLSLSLGYRE